MFAKTLEKRPNDPNARYQFAVALAHLQRTREAMSHYASALLLQPDFPDALDGLAWILATATNAQFRNGAEALRMAERSCELTGRKDAQKVRTLAAAYAEVGRFTEATSTITNAVELASQTKRADLTKECGFMLEAFKAHQPWREPSDHTSK